MTKKEDLKSYLLLNYYLIGVMNIKTMLLMITGLICGSALALIVLMAVNKYYKSS